MNACAETWNAERVALAVEALQRSGGLRLRVQGMSMLPSLWPGDEVEIASCSSAELKRGDLALAFRDGRFFLHRVLALSENGDVIMRGDAMPRPDAPFGAAEIVGVVTGGSRTAFPVLQRFALLRRALGLLFCYSSVARSIALRLHSQSPETQQTASLRS